MTARYSSSNPHYQQKDSDGPDGNDPVEARLVGAGLLVLSLLGVLLVGNVLWSLIQAFGAAAAVGVFVAGVLVALGWAVSR